MRIILLVLLLLCLAGCGGAGPAATPTSTKTPASQSPAGPTESPATPTPPPPPPPTEAPVPEAANPDAATIERLFKVLVVQAAVEKSLSELSAKMQAGEADGLEGLGGLLALGALLKGADDALAGDYPADLAPHLETARQQQERMRSILRRWVDKEITSADVPTELEGMDTEAALLTFAEAMKTQGLTKEKMEEIIDSLSDAMQQAAP
jgi:predicted small lipoprotein YifL